ncbi:MAG: ATP-binding protein [Alphaproteobacteria bacterium]|nr:ATP-binding protein [Alphaproteobacteria bacterium]
MKNAELTTELLAIIVKHIPSAVAVLNQDMHRLYANERWSQLHDLSEISPTEDFFSKLPPALKADCERCLDHRTIVCGMEKDGKKAYCLTWEIIPWNTSSDEIGGLVIFIDDRTDRKRSDEKIYEMVNKLSQSNQALEEFAFVCSHELREPLRTIANFFHLIEKHNANTMDATTQEYLGFIKKSIHHMETLINDLIEHSIINSNKNNFTSKVVCINDIIDNVRDILSAKIIETGATLEYGKLPCIYGERAQLVQLFQNLIGNSLKFRSTHPPRIKITAEQKGDFWQFALADNGIGIEKLYHKKIFLMFERLHSKEKYEGSGIGLALCEKIVKNHGGEIYIQSNTENGCTVYFTLPSTSPNKTSQKQE